MKKVITGGLLAAFALAAPAQEWKAAVEALPKYEFGQPRAALVPLDDAIRTGGKDAADRKALEAALAAVISGEATVEAKRYALRGIGPIATADSIGVIAGALKDPKTADTAMWALERITDPAAGKALIDGLAAAQDDATKIAYITSLGWRREAAAGEALSKALGGSEAVAIAAANALARIDSAPACGSVREAHAKAQGALRDALANALLLCAEKSNDKAEALATYTALFAETESPKVRAAALNGLVKAEPDKALARVVQALSGQDLALARVATGFVRELPGAEATTAFAGLLGEVPAATKIILIDALADRGDVAAREAVVAATGSKDEAVTLAALRALGKIGNATDATALLISIVNGSADAKRIAQTSLNTLPGEGVNAALVAMAKQGDKKLRSAAINALAERRAKETRGDLIALLDADADLKGDVYAALGALADEADLPTLLTRLTSGAEKDDVAALQRVITAASNRIAAEDKRAAAAADALAKATTPETRAQLVAILAGIPTKESLAALRGAVKGDDAGVRLAAVKAIAAWPDDVVVDDLLQVFRNAAADEDRAAALLGYVRIVREAKEISSNDALTMYEIALQFAKNTGERKQIISGLAKVPSKRAIDLLRTLAEDPELKTDVTSGYVSVSRLISGADPAYAKQMLEPLAKDESPEPIKKPARAALALIGGFEDYITAWEVAGPYFRAGETGRDLFDIPFAPENAPETVRWNICPLAYNNPESPDLKPWAVDLGATLKGQERVAYLRTNLESESAQDAVLELGTNDGCKVWFNGKEIFGFKEGRPLIPGQDKLPIKLEKGKNTLMIAVYQHGGQWAAAARVADKAGKALAGVKATIEE